MCKETKYPRGKETFDTMQSWCQDKEGVPEYKLREARKIVGICSEYSYDTPIKKEVMYRFLEKAEKEDKRIEIVPDDDFLPGGCCQDQCDGWTYHPVLLDNNFYTDEEDYWTTGGNTGTLPNRVTPSIIKSLMSDEIFVFGSNKQGMHMGGAARVAFDKFGAEWGNGEGLQGHSYALPTMEGMESMTEAVKRFVQYAEEHDEYLFYVTLVACGIAGYTAEEVAPLFKDSIRLSNVYLPISFWKVILNIK